MPSVSRDRHEAFAQALARGLAFREAAAAAGYKSFGGSVLAMAKSEWMVNRIAEIDARARGGGSSDVSPIIDDLMRLAGVAEKMGTAAGMMAAKHLLAEAAKLKKSLPEDIAPPLTEGLRPIMTHEEWVKAYVPVA